MRSGLGLPPFLPLGAPKSYTGAFPDPSQGLAVPRLPARPRTSSPLLPKLRPFQGTRAACWERQLISGTIKVGSGLMQGLVVLGTMVR